MIIGTGVHLARVSEVSRQILSLTRDPLVSSELPLHHYDSPFRYDSYC
jgi:hypothetical protein